MIPSHGLAHRLPIGILIACAACVIPISQVAPLRVSELGSSGDPARRASLRLVVEGLRAESAQGGARAKASFERAIQVDPTNPYAYLALARHHADGPKPREALHYLDQARSLLESEGALSPRVEPHLLGLRGQVLYKTGETGLGASELQRASRMAPSVWNDGHLTADELL